MRLFISFAIMLVIGLSLQGCGRKGPLTMPPVTNAAAVSQATPSSAAPPTSTVK